MPTRRDAAEERVAVGASEIVQRLAIRRANQHEIDAAPIGDAARRALVGGTEEPVGIENARGVAVVRGADHLR